MESIIRTNEEIKIDAYEKYIKFINDPIRQAFQNQILRLHQVGMVMWYFDGVNLNPILESPYKEMVGELHNKLLEYEKTNYDIK